MDVRFLEIFEESAITEQLIDYDGKFTFYHFYIPHAPWRVNEELKYESGLSGPSGYMRQARGALLLANRIINKLKSIGIYDSSEIIIMSDHGTMSIPPISRVDEGFAGISLKTQSSSMALLLHKRPFADFSGIRVNDAELYLKDIQCLVSSRTALAGDICDEVKSSLAGASRERVFLDYEWSNESWRTRFLPPMTVYHLNGHAYDVEKWQRGSYRYSEGAKEEISKLYVRMNEPISFRGNGNSSEVILFGWSIQEPNHRWTDNERAGLSIKLKEIPTRDIALVVDFAPYRNMAITQQSVKVSVNGKYIITWDVSRRDRYIAHIPEHLVSAGQLDVLFEISSPAVPFDFGESNDRRLLGMAVYELMITEADNVPLPHAASEESANNKVVALQVGQSALLTEKGLSSQIIQQGWSGQEPTHRWTEGSAAGLLLRVQDYENKDLLLRFDASAYLGGGRPHQTVGVLVNGQKVDTWQMAGRNWYEAVIPASIAGDGLLNIVFEISNPTAPCEVSDSKDCRKLGIAARELVIEYVQP